VPLGAKSTDASNKTEKVEEKKEKREVIFPRRTKKR